MSSNPSISVSHICKCYHIYPKPSLRLLQMLLGRRKKFYSEFSALKNVSFEVARGETLAIIGRNGCGKSTLLQIICGTLNQTSGQVQTSGTIAALLELGSCFNPEFSGRDNVYLYASILGYSQDQIKNRFSQIEAFADIGEYLDRPVKTYSSGMTVRLAFSVAIHVEPDILVIDEALAVGDELFQRKCYSKINELKKRGSTILFVSHSATAVVSLCDRAILLDKGELLATGSPKVMMGLYQRLLYAPGHMHNAIRTEIRAGSYEQSPAQTPKRSAIQEAEENESDPIFDSNLVTQSAISYEQHGARISNLAVHTLDGKPANRLRYGERYVYSYDIEFSTTAADISCGMLIKNKAGVDIGGAISTTSPHIDFPVAEAGTRARVSFQFTCHLNPGLFYFNAGVQGTTDERKYLHRILDGFVVAVVPQYNSLSTGIVNFNCTSTVTRIDTSHEVSNL